MPGEDSDPEFEAFVERVMELKRCLPELAALLAEIEAEGYDVQTHPGLSRHPPELLEAMRKFTRGELTEGEMFFQAVGILFPANETAG